MVGRGRVILVGASVIIYEDDKILLQKRRDNSLWAVHGGCVEIGEKVEDAAKRELFEETGLKANRLELLGVFSGEDTMYTYPNGDEAYIVDITYICRDFSGDMSADPEEVSELRWFNIDQLPENISPPDVKPVEAFVEYIKNGDKRA